MKGCAIIVRMPKKLLNQTGFAVLPLLIVILLVLGSASVYFLSTQKSTAFKNLDKAQNPTVASATDQPQTPVCSTVTDACVPDGPTGSKVPWPCCPGFTRVAGDARPDICTPGTSKCIPSVCRTDNTCRGNRFIPNNKSGEAGTTGYETQCCKGYVPVSCGTEDSIPIYKCAPAQASQQYVQVGGYVWEPGGVLEGIPIQIITESPKGVVGYPFAQGEIKTDANGRWKARFISSYKFSVVIPAAGLVPVNTNMTGCSAYYQHCNAAQYVTTNPDQFRSFNFNAPDAQRYFHPNASMNPKVTGQTGRNVTIPWANPVLPVELFTKEANAASNYFNGITHLKNVEIHINKFNITSDSQIGNCANYASTKNNWVRLYNYNIPNGWTNYYTPTQNLTIPKQGLVQGGRYVVAINSYNRPLPYRGMRWCSGNPWRQCYINSDLSTEPDKKNLADCSDIDYFTVRLN